MMGLRDYTLYDKAEGYETFLHRRQFCSVVSAEVEGRCWRWIWLRMRQRQLSRECMTVGLGQCKSCRRVQVHAAEGPELSRAERVSVRGRAASWSPSASYSSSLTNMAQGCCQKCRQPLLFDSSNSNALSLQDSIAALTPSTYDLLSASERRPLPPSTSTAAAAAGRLPQARRALFEAATKTRPGTTSSGGGGGTRSSSTTAPTRVQVTSPYPHTSLGPGESFVVLDHVAQSLAALPPAHSARITSASPSLPAITAPSNNAESFSNNADHSSPAAPSPLTPHLTQLATLTSYLSSRSSIDHPLCTECMEILLGMMGKELEEGKRERERLAAWEREVAKRREEAKETGMGKEALEREIAKVSCTMCVVCPPGCCTTLSPWLGCMVSLARRSADLGLLHFPPLLQRSAILHSTAKPNAWPSPTSSPLKQNGPLLTPRLPRSMPKKRSLLARKRRELRCLHSAGLAADRISTHLSFWRDHATYVLEAADLRDRANALQTRYEHDVKNLEKLQKTNVYSASAELFRLDMSSARSG